MINYLTLKTFQSIFSGIKHSTKSLYIIFNWSTCCFMIEDINKKKIDQFSESKNRNQNNPIEQCKIHKSSTPIPPFGCWGKKKKNLIYLKLTEMNITYFEQKQTNQITYFFFFFFEIKDRYCINNINQYTS